MNNNDNTLCRSCPPGPWLPASSASGGSAYYRPRGGPLPIEPVAVRALLLAANSAQQQQEARASARASAAEGEARGGDVSASTE